MQMVTLTVVDGSGNSSSCIAIVTVISTVSVEDVFEHSMSLHAYPSLVENEVHIQYESPLKGDVSVEVVNMWGQVLQEKSMTKSEDLLELAFQLGTLPTGMYVIRVSQLDMHQSIRIVKK